MNRDISIFTNIFQVAKTLRFELIPQGNTFKQFNNNNFINKDEHRAESYTIVKDIIDDYHRDFIDVALNEVQLTDLDAFYELYFSPNKNNSGKQQLIDIQTRLRKQIANRFSKHPDDRIRKRYFNIFKKELITQDLHNWILTNKEESIVGEFNKFTTYFRGFHKNRENMYSAEEKSSAISYRIIHENLPKYLDNLKVINLIKTKYIDFNFEQISELCELLDIQSIEKYFTVSSFNNTLTQLGISKYNNLLGGYTKKDKKIQGLNEVINLYRQKNHLAKKDLPNLVPLYKQILSDRSTISFIPNSFDNDQELIENITKFYNEEIIGWVFEKNNLLRSIKKLIEQLAQFDITKIYIKNDSSLTNISKKFFGDWSLIRNALRDYYMIKINPKPATLTKKYENLVNGFVNNSKYFDIEVIEKAVLLYQEHHSEIVANISKHPICNYFANFEQEIRSDNKTVKLNIIDRIYSSYENIKSLLENDYPIEKKLIQDSKNKVKIKEFLDNINTLRWYIKPLQIGQDIETKDVGFYNDFIQLFDQLSKITTLYNKTRNYLTKKPYSTEKIKLNFENSTLLSGWDANKEKDNTSVLLIRDDKYYLAIMDKNHNKVFENIPKSGDMEFYKKIHYKLLPGANKMLPKVFFSKSRIDYFAPSNEIIKNYKKGTHKKGNLFNIKDCYALIDFFKSSINKHPDWKNFNFNFSDTMKYNDMSDFYKEVEQQGYKITFVDVPVSYIDQLVNTGKLYLFQIYNKDFSNYSSGRPNLHTIYWKMLFDKENLNDVVYKLNGEAEIFYRKRSLNSDDMAVHKAGSKLANKNKLNQKQISKFKYDIIKDKRYTCDKFQFHVPITLNFKASGQTNINSRVNRYLKNNSDTHIIGIDRGERHLLYISVVNQKGQIIEQYSLNNIINNYNNNTYGTDYHQLLEQKEKERKQARVNWSTIRNIKELKQGYLSQVVHKISGLIVKYNAIIAMEDLNFGFKRGRIKVEKQIYQKFEKMLIDKLNYLINKKLALRDVCGPLNALQLTNKFTSFKKLGKQCGFIFYVPAWNTSKIDPITGFVNLFYTKYENISKAKLFFKKFDSIRYIARKDHFEFDFDYSNFTLKGDGTKTQWTVCADNRARYKWRKKLNNGKGGYEMLEVAKMISELFESKNINFRNGEDLISQIIAQKNLNFFRQLIKLFTATISLRHNNGKKGRDEEDNIISPVYPFFNSKYAKENQPVDADANGAYHIALKGLWAKHQIDKSENLNKLKLAISNKEWLNWIQKRPFSYER